MDRSAAAPLPCTDLGNDALIALSACQVGATVVTDNVDDFALLHEYVAFALERFSVPTA